MTQQHYLVGATDLGDIRELAGAAPELRFADTVQTDPAGRYRIRDTGDVLYIQRAATANWATATDLITVDENSGNVNVRIGNDAPSDQYYTLHAAQDWGEAAATDVGALFARTTRSETGAATNAINLGVDARAVIGGTADAVTNNKNWTATVGLRAVYGVILTNTGSTGAVTGGASFYAANATISGATLTNQYGLYIEDLTSGGSDYGIYIAGADTAAIYVAADDVVIVSGGLLVGNATQVASGETTSELQVLGTAVADGSITVYLASTTDALGPSLRLVKNANATIGTNTTSVANGEELGDIRWYGTDTADADTNVARLVVKVDDATPTTGDIGAAFIWENMPGGGGAIREALRLGAAGNLNIATAGVGSGATFNLVLGGGATSPVLGAAAADVVSLAAVDVGAGDRRLYIQSEAGSPISIGNDTLDVQTGGLTIGLGASAPAPDNNKVHIWSGTAGAVTAGATADLVVESNANSTITFLVPDGSFAGIEFGHGTDPQYSYILQRNDLAGDPLNFLINNLLNLSWTSGAFAFQTNTLISSTGTLGFSNSIDMNSNSITEIGNAGSQLLADAWTMVSANTPVFLVETSGAATSSIISLKIPESGTGNPQISWVQGSGVGSANNMGLLLYYNGNAGTFQLYSYDIDGSSGDGYVWKVTDGTNDVKFAGGISTDGAVAPTSGATFGLAGTATGIARFAGTTSGVVSVTVAAAAGTWTMTLPTAVGTGGFQLTDAAGNGVTSWAAAGSRREWKNDRGLVSPQEALDTILGTVAVHRFTYKKGFGTGDYNTEYVGLFADEAPWAMHFGNSIVNPVNTLGYMVGGFKAVDSRLSLVEEQVKDIADRTWPTQFTEEGLKRHVKAIIAADPEFRGWLKQALEV